MSPYRVNLDIFAGPLDLLLYLVRKDEVDIYDIPISSITEQYIKYIEVLKKIDIELAGDFLVMAATLMEVKSAMLIPSVDPEEMDEGEEGDPRTELVRQLLEYKRFKDMANMLGQSAEDRQKRFTRPDSVLAQLKDEQEPELDLDEVSVWTLLEAFDAMMEATGRLHSYDHISDDTSIDLYQIELLERLQSEGAMSFEDIFNGKTNQMQMIGLFLAMLELMRSDLIWAEQGDLLGAVSIRSLTDEPAAKAVQDAIYTIQQAEDVNVTSEEVDADLADVVDDTDVVENDNTDISEATIMDEIGNGAKKAVSDESKFSIPIKEWPGEKGKKKATGRDYSLKDKQGDPGQSE